MATKRLPRLIRLLTTIQSDPHQGPAELAEVMGVSRRTLFRDLQALAEAGVPIVHEAGKGYRVRESFFLPPVSLSVPEAVGVMLLGVQAQAQPDKPFHAAGLSAIRKLASLLPGPLRAGCEEVVASASYRPTAQVPGSAESPIYPLLQRAIDTASVCRMTYCAPLREPAEVTLRPLQLHFSERAWYVYGRSDLGDEVRAFKLTRIADLTVTDARYTPEPFEVASHLGSAWQMIPEGKMHDVSIVFDALVATNVSEVRWHRSQRTEPLRDGRVRLHFQVDGLTEIAWWVCGYADRAEVQAPAELRERVAGMLRAAAGRYARPDPSDALADAPGPEA
jgi:predicted DNA-binding transcriptional regulator YafY